MPIRNLRKDVASGKLGDEIIETLRRCASISKKDYVPPPKEKSLPSINSALFELLKLLLRLKSLQEGVVAKLITDDEELRRFCTGNDENLPMLCGWRREIFGNDALALRRGELSISYDAENHRIKILRIENQ